MNNKTMLVFIVWLVLLLVLTGCAANEPTPTAIAEENSPTPTTTLTSTATALPEPSATATVTASPTPTSTPTPTPTPTSLPTAMPHPLANVTSQIIFASYRDSHNPEIYVMNADGSNWQRLTTDDFIDYGPQPSPDGEKIAFSSNRDGLFQIYTMNRDGSDLIRVSRSVGEDQNPTWSPDGKQLAFDSERDGKQSLFVINADGSSERLIDTGNLLVYSPLWSPNGTWIAFSASSVEGDPNIYIVRPDGSDLQRMTFSPNYDGDQASWSPDSQWLIFPSRRIGNYELYGVKVDGSQFGTITRTEGDEFSGLLSPDGRYLLINAYYEEYIGLIVRDLETGEDVRLTDAAADASYATWLPQPQVTFSDLWLTQTLTESEACVYATDEAFGYDAENPIPMGNGPSFGGPFDGMHTYSFVRVMPGEAQTSIRGHNFPSNSQGDYLDTIILTSESGREVVLYVNINDYSIPQIPVGLFCDLALP